MYRFLIITILLAVTNNWSVYCQSELYSFSQDTYRKSEIFNKSIETNDEGIKILDAVLFYVTNEQRIKEGLAPLKYNKYLEKTALLHSEDMVKQGFFDHINHKNKKHKTPEDRAKSVGIQNPYIAENIIDNFVINYSSGTPVYTDGTGKFWYKKESDPITKHTYLSLADKLLDEWMHSPGHRKNILSKDALELGCGVAFYKNNNGMPSVMGTQNFQLYELLK
jgi:uncharacterized protein YkwD